MEKNIGIKMRIFVSSKMHEAISSKEIKIDLCLIAAISQKNPFFFTKIDYL